MSDFKQAIDLFKFDLKSKIVDPLENSSNLFESVISKAVLLPEEEWRAEIVPLSKLKRYRKAELLDEIEMLQQEYTEILEGFAERMKERLEIILNDVEERLCAIPNRLKTCLETFEHELKY